jgi:short-subunit dehydrogenase
MNVKGKVAIVTGGSSGIGKAVVQLLTQKGATVVSVSRHGPVVADMTKPQDIKKMIAYSMKKFGKIDILVNNAGRGYDAAVEFTDSKVLHDIFDLDVVGPLVAMQQVIPIMRNQGGGSIVNISSGTALLTLPNMSPYASLKRALAYISKTANMELANDNIAISVVYPYSTKTDFEKHTIKGKEIKVEWGGGKTLPEFDSPEYVANKILEAIQTGKPEIYAHEWMKKMVK